MRETGTISCQPNISFLLLVHLPNRHTSFALFLSLSLFFLSFLLFSFLALSHYHPPTTNTLFLCLLLTIINAFVMPRVLRKKIVIIGDGACGKTSLLIVYQKGKFPEVNAIMVHVAWIPNTSLLRQRIALSTYSIRKLHYTDRA